MNSSNFRTAAIAASLVAAATAAQGQTVLTLNDGVVENSLCVGFDCGTGISFGFDTIRLRENNLRIHFEDTSTSAAFPSTDWAIQINDSSNGGQNYFGIVDRTASRTPFKVEGNAPSNALVVDDGGRLGLGTGSPALEVHVVDGDSPGVRLQQDGSSGFVPQSWDIAGNETNFFVRDVSNGSTLPFRIRPGAPTSSVFIAEGGNVGIGTSSPETALDIETSADEIVSLRLGRTTGANPVAWLINNDNADGQLVVELEGGNKPFKISQTARANLMRLGVTGNSEVDITGTLFTNGSCSVGCDRVFAPDYPLLTIDEQVQQMWSKSYLPNVGPTAESGRYDLTDKVLRMLSELEKAHIYIGQLHDRIETLEAKVEG